MNDDKVARTPAESELMVEWLFQNSHDLMFAVGPDGRVVDANAEWTAFTGWTRDEIIGRRICDLAHPHDALAAGQMGRGAPGEEAGEHIIRLLTKHGALRTCRGRSRRTSTDVTIGLLRPSANGHAISAPAAPPKSMQAALADAVGIGAWSYDPGDNRLIMSQLILDRLGYSAEEVATLEQMAEMLHPDDRAALACVMEIGVRQGVAQSYEHRVFAKDGTCTTWRATFEPQARDDGQFILRGVSQDITELVRVRDLAQRSEQQSRQIIECAPVAVAMFDRDLRYMVVSPRWRHGFGLSDRDHIGYRLEEIFSGIPKRFIAAQKRALTGEVVSRPEDRFTDSRGREHRIRWEVRPWRDASGDIGGVLAFADDISALVATRETAETNARRLRMALEAADAGVYEIDYVGKTFWASPEFIRLVGATCDSYEDALHLVYPGFHPDDRTHVRDTFLAIQRGERQSGDAFEARILRPDGGTRWVRVHHHVELDRRGRPLKGVGLVLDFDVRKRQELALIEAQRSAEAAAEAKASFLANMSHEIRTPMNGVMGVLHLLKNEGLSAEGRGMLEEALSCGQMLAELLNDVIDFSKIEAGHLQVSSEPLDPRAVVDGVVRLLTPQAEARGLYLTADVDDDLGWVRTDPVRLRQALFNLVGNAVKFTLQGGVVIRCRPRAGDGGTMLRFEIEDTGVGIPQAVQPRIFQRFDQGDASTTRRFGGSGLGLAITLRLAEMMGGAVGFSSIEGEGSVFWLEIAAEAVETPELVAEAGDACLDGLRILVVEDNPTNRMIATKILENMGVVVETAADGLLGVETAARGDFDLILMDVQMPGMDGLEAARQIRRLTGAAARTPILALTANVLSHQRDAYLEAGMNGVVGKPISPAALLAEIARLVTPEAPVAVSAA